LPVLAPGDVGNAAFVENVLSDCIAVVALVAQHDEPSHLTEHFDGTLDVDFVPGNELEVDELAVAIGDRAELGVAATFGLSESLLFSGLGEVAGVLVDFHMGRVDDLELVNFGSPYSLLDHVLEHSPFGPSIVKAVDAIPLAVALGKLIPLAARDEDPPDAAQCFEKIRRRTALFANVRLALLVVKLIFLRARRARPASLSQI